MKLREKTTIAGGGPVGSLFSIYLSKAGYDVEVFEKREDPRTVLQTEGRSINMALSHRGLRALGEVGLDEPVKEHAVPMKGRMIHDINGQLTFQPYGEEGQMIYSVSRKKLNELLIARAEKEHKVKFYFNESCINAETNTGIITILRGDKEEKLQTEVLFAADGAFSAIRNSFKDHPDFNYNTEKLSHSYKELHMNAAADGKHQMEPNALHIWPREKFMLIALPNTDGSFTCTLFLPNDGNISFERIKTTKEVSLFFEKYFSDVIPLIPDLTTNYLAHPESSLVTLHCFPWHFNQTLLIGDAAHAITPFYGQGMNAGFEDCRILNELIQKKEGDWIDIFSEFEKLRKPNADAIAELALQNFIEMRDLVGDAHFLLRKKIESAIHQKYPSYLPLYTMVTFSDFPYEEALLKGQEHDRLMEKIMSLQDIHKLWNTNKGWEQIEKIVEDSFIKKDR